MNIPVCDICRREMKADIRLSEHYCERCIAFAEEYRNERMKIAAEVSQQFTAQLERRIESYRNKYLREVVIPATKPTTALKAV